MADTKMNIYQKVALARVMLQEKELKKSGNNKFAGYTYFELGDFLPTINKIFNDLLLCSQVSFNTELATLKVIDSETGEFMEFTSPMAGASLKGCHDIQNMGAVQTYQRRYLYMSALEIVEHDALDSVTGSAEQQPRQQQQPVNENMTAEEAGKMVIGFGKHKGLTLKEIYKKDSQYFTWLKDKAQTESIKHAVTVMLEALKDKSLSKIQPEPVSVDDDMPF